MRSTAVHTSEIAMTVRDHARDRDHGNAQHAPEAHDLLLERRRLPLSPESSISAITPVSVSIPVAVITACPVPCTTAVPLNAVFVRSASATACVSVVGSLRTASLSPVSDASCTRNAAARTETRVGADRIAFAEKKETSPGTSSRQLGTRCTRPSRSTADVTGRHACERPRRHSRLSLPAPNPSTTLTTTMSAMTIASTGTPCAPSINHAMSEMPIAPRRR